MMAQTLISACRARGKKICVLVRVHKTKGSTPRETGAMMLVSEETLQGSIGGGRLEQEAIQIARSQIEVAQGNIKLGARANAAKQTANSQPYLQTFALGASLGQCCGGKVELSFEILWPDCSIPENLQHKANSHEANIPPIVLFGAGHVGRALVNIMATLPCQLTWVDSRANEFARFSSDLPSHIKPVLTDSTESGLDEVAQVALAQSGSAFVVMTHSHALDLDICAAILKRQDFAYLGLIGSQTKAARFKHRLLERHMNNVDQLTCPIGILGIKGKQPAVVALSIAASLAQLKRPLKTDQNELSIRLMPNKLSETI